MRSSGERMGGPHSLMHKAMTERHLGERKTVARAAPLRKPKSQHPPPKRMVSARLSLGHTWDQEARFASSTCHHIPLSKEASTTLALRKASLHRQQCITAAILCSEDQSTGTRHSRLLHTCIGSRSPAPRARSGPPPSTFSSSPILRSSPCPYPLL